MGECQAKKPDNMCPASSVTRGYAGVLSLLTVGTDLG